MDDEKLVIVGVIIVILTVISSIHFYNTKIDRLRYANNYCEVALIGTASTVWKKCDNK